MPLFLAGLWGRLILAQYLNEHCIKHLHHLDEHMKNPVNEDLFKITIEQYSLKQNCSSRAASPSYIQYSKFEVNNNY